MTKTQQVSEQAMNNPLARNFSVVSLLRFAFPTICMMIFSGLYTIVDTIFVSRFVNTNALSSINIVTPIINIIVGLAAMLATGGNAIIARKMGNNNNKEARENFTLIITVGFIFGLLIACIGLVFLESIIRGLGASNLLFPYCRNYLTVLLIFAPANILQVLFSNLFVTAGKPGIGFGLCFAAGFTNALFDYIFIVLLQIGIQGAALATSMGFMVPTIAGILFFLRNKNSSLYFSKPRLDIKMLGKSCFNGSSEMVGQLSTAVTTFLFNAAMMHLLGEDGVAAITIIIYTQFLLTTLFIGFSIGVAPVISYNYGCQDHIRLKRIIKICIGFTLTTSIAVFILATLGGSFLVHIFSPKNTPVYEIAQAGFQIFSFSFLFCGANIFTSAMFTALSNGKISAIISFLRTFIFLVLGILLLPIFWKTNGIWMSVPLAELMSFFFSLYFVLRNKEKYHYL